ncbi:MAG TPA: calcium-translocating P-type ATPase, SERCA-type [Methylomusa anaerophila]|uniref:P-type Ca(2+) transporter n=1 Tax=Methylomusa anaerophila TaxID=1930071 RepID=A0A348APL9_9FIRM|nr:calcium-translocating P-type ATPase, SERCA-type [Methylomusa anaerophila]BBB93017.1 calcium-transporting ATPase [Methylomusa anaerophila]HML87150.1 calcium-translocating P-type ATPase, SERCA-type [Methylomusa anaerophila]
MDKEKWYARSADEVVAFWQTCFNDGLSSAAVKNRLSKFGYNEIAEKSKEPWWKRFLSQFQDFMVLILLAATLISGFLGEYADAITILAIVLLNALLGFFQEYRAEQSLNALKKLSAPTARVIRNGIIQQIPARELVPGDILVLEAGDKLAADGRLLSVHNLEVEEAALTGESLPVRKVADKKFSENAPLGDRKNMIFAGTSICRGRGKAVVCATGMSTEVGHIANMIQAAAVEPTPLEKRLEHLGRWLVWGCLAICMIVVITGIMKGESLFLMCMTGISLAVAAIPEGLPAIVTVALALGVQRMIRQHAIIRKLPAVETLGCTTVICSDKTGTLTQNAMTVRQVFAGNDIFEVTGLGYDIKGSFLLNNQPVSANKHPSLLQCLKIGALCNNSSLKQNNVIISGTWRKNEVSGLSVEGDPTEGAITVAAAKAAVWRQDFEKNSDRVGEIPFESERRRMSVVYHDKDTDTHWLYAKGAPDTIIDLCRHCLTESGIIPLNQEIIKKISAVNESMAGKALRVLAVAYRPFDKNQVELLNENHENNLIFVGLLGMIDPPREEAKKSITLCLQAGIKTVMITGDHRDTAVAIARELQIYQEGKHKALTGHDLDTMSDKDLAAVVNEITVYARVSPAHKLRIVKALKRRGHIVAMTGDGVNDAPAIKEADIGVAMGLTGTDVSKEASAMILADDNFATIVAAVEEGRGIYDNIRKFIRYLLACNIGEVLTMFLAALSGLPMPLLPVQILWVNLVTDGLPAMALGVDPNDPHIMQRPPRHPKESVFSRGLIRKIISRGFQIGLSTLLVFSVVYYLKNDLPLARTAAFTTLVFCQLFHVFDCRSEILTIFELKFTTNKYLLGAVFFSTVMELAVIYVPSLRSIFSTVPLSLSDWTLVLIASGWSLILNGVKHVFRQRRLANRPAFNKVR